MPGTCASEHSHKLTQCPCGPPHARYFWVLVLMPCTYNSVGLIVFGLYSLLVVKQADSECLIFKVHLWETYHIKHDY